MSVYLIGLTWVVGAVTVSTGSMIAIRRMFSVEHRRAGDEATNRVFTIVAGLEAVLATFVLINVFSAIDTTRANACQEADSLVTVYWDADLLPAGSRAQIQQDIRQYAATVVGREWPAMQDGKPVAETGKEQLDRIHEAIAAVAPDSVSQEDRQTQIDSDLGTVYSDRQRRLDESTTSVNPIVWLALIVGGALSVGLTCLFGGEKIRTHIIAAGALAGTLAVLLYATYQLQNPFGGAVRISPEMFSSAFSQFG
jgi:uncharacterized protein DUF4239